MFATVDLQLRSIDDGHEQSRLKGASITYYFYLVDINQKLSRTLYRRRARRKRESDNVPLLPSYDHQSEIYLGDDIHLSLFGMVASGTTVGVQVGGTGTAQDN